MADEQTTNWHAVSEAQRIAILELSKNFQAIAAVAQSALGSVDNLKQERAEYEHLWNVTRQQLEAQKRETDLARSERGCADEIAALKASLADVRCERDEIQQAINNLCRSFSTCD